MGRERQTTTSLGYHELSYDAVHRRISDILPVASMSFVLLLLLPFSH